MKQTTLFRSDIIIILFEVEITTNKNENEISCKCKQNACWMKLLNQEKFLNQQIIKKMVTQIRK